jgi:hypothetical protein
VYIHISLIIIDIKIFLEKYMTHKILAVAVAGLVAFAAPVAASTMNLVTNGGFDQDGLTNGGNWQVSTASLVGRERAVESKFRQTPL